MTDQEKELVKSLLNIIQDQAEFMLSLSRQLKEATSKIGESLDKARQTVT